MANENQSQNPNQQNQQGGQGGQQGGGQQKPGQQNQQKKLDDLKKLSGKALDTAYDKMQLEAHREAVDMFTKYSQTGDNADLKQWAFKTLPHLKEHLSMAEKLK